MSEKLAQSIQKVVTFCEKIEFKRQPFNIEIIVTGKKGTVKNVWLPESDHLDRMSDYIDIIVDEIWKEEQSKKKKNDSRTK